MKVTDFKFGLIGPTYEFASCVVKEIFKESMHVDLYRTTKGSTYSWYYLSDGSMVDEDIQRVARVEERLRLQEKSRAKHLIEAKQAAEELKLMKLATRPAYIPEQP